MDLSNRSLTAQQASTTSFTTQQNRSVLIAGLTCASFSILAALVTFRWFALTKRNFHHQLIIFLILCDTFKAFWYFVFPVVVFSRGPVSSSSGFCQASGFFLSIGIEASDLAILMIALHSMLYIFHPPASIGEHGGLYRWRKWIYLVAIGLPLLAASLAFLDNHDPYTTSGAFCYLPRRPFWYRLALSWIPRYFIMFIIFVMYSSVYVYVTVKFRGFSNLHELDSQYSFTSQTRRSSIQGDEIAPDETVRRLFSVSSPKRPRDSRPAFSRSGSYTRQHNQPAQGAEPWDEVSFITAVPFYGSEPWQFGSDASDPAPGPRDPSLSNERKIPQALHTPVRLAIPPLESRKSSHASRANSHSSQVTGTTTTINSYDVSARHLSGAITRLGISSAHTKPNDPLRRTRRAICKQLRYLFIYPGLYFLMWIFPFASHCLLYDDYYVQHPIYWLTMVSTCMVSLQAGANCVVFSWREKPWRQITDNNRFSLHSLRPPYGTRHDMGKDRSSVPSIAVIPDDPFASGTSSRNTSDNWWEAEGLKRKDSVWLGTDASNLARGGGELDTQQLAANIPGTIEEENETATPDGYRPEILMHSKSDGSLMWHDIEQQ